MCDGTIKDRSRVLGDPEVIQMGTDRISTEKSASVDRWREVAIGTAASAAASAKAERMRGARR